jgi:hypothetical protein
MLVVAAALALTPHAAAQTDDDLPTSYRLDLEKRNVERYYTLYGIGLGATVATGFPGPAIMAVAGDLAVQSAEDYARAARRAGLAIDTTELEGYRRSHNGGLITTGLGSVVIGAGAATFAYGYKYAEDETWQITGAAIAATGAVAAVTGLIIDAVAVTRTRDWVREEHRRLR